MMIEMVMIMFRENGDDDANLYSQNAPLNGLISDLPVWITLLILKLPSVPMERSAVVANVTQGELVLLVLRTVAS